MENYWNQEIECASREDMKKLQDERLVAQVKHVYENVKYYRDLMDEKGVKPEDIKSTDDLHKLPFISKADLRDAYPYGLLAKPLSVCVRIHYTSGTTGRRVVGFDTHLYAQRPAIPVGGVGDVEHRQGVFSWSPEAVHLSHFGSLCGLNSGFDLRIASGWDVLVRCRHPRHVGLQHLRL